MSAETKKPDRGYGSPPVETRFKPGKSGNPKGRPRKARAETPIFAGLSEIDELALKIANQQVTVREGDRTTTLTLKEAALRSEAAQAAKGKRLDRRDMLERLDRIEVQQKAEKIKNYEEWSEIKEAYTRQIARGESPLPHPDDIVVGPGFKVAIVGPLDAEELAGVEQLARLRDLMGLQAAFDIHYLHKRMDKAQSKDLVPMSMLLMYWIDARMPRRFRLGSSGIAAATDAHIWRSPENLEIDIKQERQALGIDPGGRLGPMTFATVAQAKQMFGKRRSR
jgi:hypothetical protein